MRASKKSIFTTVTALANAIGEPEMVVSTSTPDREGDRVMPEGARIDNFLKNPVLLWSHNYYELPIGSITKLSVDENGIRQRWRWLEGDPLAERVKNAWNQGVVRAASIGFSPLQYERNEFNGYDLTDWELLEISLVPIPANPQAVRALKALGLQPQYDSMRRSESPYAELAAELTRQGITEQTFERSLRGAASEIAIDRKYANYNISPGDLEQVRRCVREVTREFLTGKTGRVF